MEIRSIEAIFEDGHFTVHRLKVDDEVLHRTTLPSTVGLILHDPVNDFLGLYNERDLSTFSDTNVIPEFKPKPMEGSYDVAKRICMEFGITEKSVSFIQTIVCDHKHSSKQVTLVYVVVDSRTVPMESFKESTGTDMIKKLGGQEALGATTAVAAHYLKLVRMKKA